MENQSGHTHYWKEKLASWKEGIERKAQNSGVVEWWTYTQDQKSQEDDGWWRWSSYRVQKDVVELQWDISNWACFNDWSKCYESELSSQWQQQAGNDSSSWYGPSNDNDLKSNECDRFHQYFWSSKCKLNKITRGETSGYSSNISNEHQRARTLKQCSWVANNEPNIFPVINQWKQCLWEFDEHLLKLQPCRRYQCDPKYFWRRVGKSRCVSN